MYNLKDDNIINILLSSYWTYLLISNSTHYTLKSILSGECYKEVAYIFNIQSLFKVPLPYLSHNHTRIQPENRRV